MQPQNSYFVKCKLKFLELESHGELNDIKELIFFENDSVSKLCILQEIYDEKTEGGRNLNKKMILFQLLVFRQKIAKLILMEILSTITK